MKDSEKFFLVILTTIGFMGCSRAYNHSVGGSIWSIPINQGFYTNWSGSSIFQVGDFLVFYFESGLYNVMEVSRREYEDCTSYNPFQVFRKGPATVPLHEEGVCYFICSLGNYCLLGQKILVQVQNSSSVRSQPPKEQPRLLAGHTTPSPYPSIQS